MGQAQTIATARDFGWNPSDQARAGDARRALTALEVAAETAVASGGEVTLEKSALGGLRAVLCLPV